MLETLFWIFCGIAAGAVAGIFPGVHPNTLIPPMLLLLAFLDPVVLALVILSMGISNLFFSTIPAVLLRSAEETTALAISPSEELAKEGRSYDAVMSFASGQLGGIIGAILLLPFFFLLMPAIYAPLKSFIPLILAIVVVYGISREGDSSLAFYASVLFALSAILGIASLSYSDSFIFPLLSGLFGIPSLIDSAKRTAVRIEGSPAYTLDLKDMKYPVLTGAVAGGFAGLLPGVGASQIAAMTMESANIRGERKKFLSVLGAINASDLIYSIVAISIIGNPRSGIAVAIGNLIGIDLFMLATFLGLIVFVSSVSFFLTIRSGSGLVSLLSRVDQFKLSLSVILFISLLAFYLTGPIGIAVLALSTMIGYAAIKSGASRTHLMGCLIAPTALWFLGIRTI